MEEPVFDAVRARQVERQLEAQCSSGRKLPPPTGEGAGVELAYLGIDLRMNAQKGKVAAVYVALLDEGGPFPAKLTAHVPKF